MEVEDSNKRLDTGSDDTVDGVGIALRFYLLTFTISWLVWGSAILSS